MHAVARELVLATYGLAFDDTGQSLSARAILARECRHEREVDPQIDAVLRIDFDAWEERVLDAQRRAPDDPLHAATLRAVRQARDDARSGALLRALQREQDAARDEILQEHGEGHWRLWQGRPPRASDPALAFPAFGPAIAEGVASRVELCSFLAAVDAWRDRVLVRLALSESLPGISPSLCDAMAWALRGRVAREWSFPAYRVHKFPRLRGADRRLLDVEALRRQARDALVWRADCIDFLSDVWDVLGEPLFGLDECNDVIAMLLVPSGVALETRCYSCLQARHQDHFRECPIDRDAMPFRHDPARSR